MPVTLYTIQRYRPKSDTTYGPVHGTWDCAKTACGVDINENWWTLTNCFNGTVTCKKCLKLENS